MKQTGVAHDALTKISALEDDFERAAAHVDA
jgi:hypothetical protein